MHSNEDVTSGSSTAVRLLAESQQLARIGAWEWIPGTEEIYCNDEFFSLLGLEKEPNNLIRLSAWGKVFSGQKYDNTQKLLADISSGVLQEGSHAWISAEGKKLYLHCWFRRHMNANGAVIRLSGCIQDLSFVREMEDELERKNDMLQQAEETALVGSWKYNFATGQAQFSPSLFHLFGLEANHDYSVQRIYDKLEPDDLQRVLSVYRQTIEDGVKRSASFRIQLPDGNMRYFNSTGKMGLNRLGERIIVGTVQDVTTQWLLHKKLGEQNEFVQSLIDSSVNCIMVVEPGGKFMLWNTECERLFSISKNKATSLSIREILGTDVRIEHALKEALAGHKGKIDLWQRPAHKESFELHFIPLHREGEKISSVFVLMHDITTLRELGDKAIRQKEFAEAVIDHSEACIFVLRKDTTILSWNAKCASVYGKSGDEVIGKTIGEAFPDLKETKAEIWLKQALEGTTLHYPEQISAVADKTFDCYVIPMKNPDDTVDSVLFMLTDISDLVSATLRVKEANRLLEQKKNELTERSSFLQTLLDTSTDYIGAYDQQLRLLEINKTALKSLGMEKNQALGKTIEELYPGVVSTPQFGYLKKALAGEPQINFEFIGNLGTRVFQGTHIPLKSPAGEVFGTLSIAHDITELKNAVHTLELLNGQLAAKNHELDRINSELTSFSYVASHDLQEPLRKIQAFISLIQARDAANLSVHAQDYFVRIRSSANRMQQMIDGLLSFSRTNTAPKRFEKKPLAQMVKNALGALREEIAESKAEIELDELPVLYVIPHQFEQLLINILSNAVKFRKHDTAPVIRISSAVVSGREIEGEVARRDQDYCCLTIADNGIGFEMEEAEKIFQMFQRLHGKSEYPGTGIGLSICRRIAQNHNGFITTSSVPGDGTRMIIYVPLQQPDAL